MKIKRFTAATLADAVALAQAKLSATAVILESRRVEGGFEVLAAVDHDSPSVRRSGPAGTTADDGIHAFNGLDASRQLFSAPNPQGIAAELDQLKRQLSVVRSELKREQDFLGQVPQHPLASSHRDLWLDLLRMGFDAQQAGRTLLNLPHDSDAVHTQTLALKMLVERIPVLLSTSATSRPSMSRVVVLIGASSAGKTTVAAKLASRHAQQFGRSSVALITLDTQRPSGPEPLLTWGRVLGISAESCSSRERLQQRIEQLPPGQLLIIDTAALSQKNNQLRRQLDLLHPSVASIELTLVLAANAQATQHAQTFAQLRGVGVSAVVITKLDESSQPAAVCAAAWRYDLPIAWLSSGTRVPQDLHPPLLTPLLQHALALAQGDNGLLSSGLASTGGISSIPALLL